jgi:hypothetical protein
MRRNAGLGIDLVVFGCTDYEYGIHWLDTLRPCNGDDSHGLYPVKKTMGHISKYNDPSKK